MDDQIIHLGTDEEGSPVRWDRVKFSGEIIVSLDLCQARSPLCDKSDAASAVTCVKGTIPLICSS